MVAETAVAARPALRGDRSVVPTGHELVTVQEAFGTRATSIALVLIAGAAAVSLALLGVRADDLAQALPGMIASVATIVGCLALVRHAPAVFLALRGDIRAQAALIAWAAAMLAVIPPLRSELWFISLGLLCLLALASSLGRAVVACAVVLLTNLLAHVVVGDLDEIDAVVIGGLWIGLPFWTVAISTTMERLSRHLLQLHRHHPALRGAAGKTDPGFARSDATLGEADRAPRSPGTDVGDPAGGLDASSSESPLGATGSGVAGPVAGSPFDAPRTPLTARQLQVVLLLVEGYQQTQIAIRLGISDRSVQRHVSSARERLGAQTTAELVALAVRAGIAPLPRDPPKPVDQSSTT